MMTHSNYRNTHETCSAGRLTVQVSGSGRFFSLVNPMLLMRLSQCQAHAGIKFFFCIFFCHLPNKIILNPFIIPVFLKKENWWERKI